MSEQYATTIRRMPISQLMQLDAWTMTLFLQRCPPRVRESIKRAWCAE